MSTSTSLLLAGICRPTWPARWQTGCAYLHAVEVHRSSDELDGGPELATCGAVVAVTTAPWDATVPEACPACTG